MTALKLHVFAANVLTTNKAIDMDRQHSDLALVVPALNKHGLLQNLRRHFSLQLLDEECQTDDRPSESTKGDCGISTTNRQWKREQGRKHSAS